MPSALDALRTLTGGPQTANDPLALAALRRKKLDDLESQYTPNMREIAPLKNDIADDPYTGVDEQKRIADIGQTNDAMNTFLRPDVTAKRQEEQTNKLALAKAPAEAAAQGNLAVETLKGTQATAEKQAQTDATQKLLQTLGGGGGTGEGGAGLAGPGGSVKPTINANGGVSFTTTQMPALVQRARNQLMDARDKTLNALTEAEKLYPGINDETTKVDKAPTEGSALGRFFSGVTGIGAPKFAGPTDRAGAGLERLNYTMGNATPFSRLAQEASFGNIEQMAGQLPGVRGLATITPLFKEHQSRWGHETPFATVQRLRHMAQMMDETLHTLDTSGAGQEGQ